MPPATATTDRTSAESALETLRRAGNPFRNYFARNPDDDVCARYHVAELFSREREQLLGVVDLYRYDPTTHSEIVPVLGNKGAGKTHLLHSIKHGNEGGWQMLVTPGTYQRDTDFLEYLLFQVIDTLLGGGKQRGARPQEILSEEVGRRLLHRALSNLTVEQQLELFPAQGLGKWARRFGLGTGQAQEKTQWLIDQLETPLPLRTPQGAATVPGTLRRICSESNLPPERACEIACQQVEQTEAHSTAGLMRRHIHQGFLRAALLGDESDLANFLTFGFAELDFRVQPGRQDLVLALFKVLMEVFLQLKIPVVVAFDQLEDLLLARRADDSHRTAEAFFAGIVQVMHQIDGICFLVFAERGLWNRFVPSLDGYIQDRLNNPVHVPGHGTIKALRLEAPAPDLLRRVVEARLRPTLEAIRQRDGLASIYPFTEEQIVQIARTEPTLRDMLQQFRHLFDHLVYGPECGTRVADNFTEPAPATNRIAATEEYRIKSVAVVQAPVETPARPEPPAAAPVTPSPVAGAPKAPEKPREVVPVQETPARVEVTSVPPAPAVVVKPAAASQQPAAEAMLPNFTELWEQELRAARRKLEPEGALTGATRELQGGLGAFLQLCHEHGVKVGPWRLQHVVGELTFGEHPTYGVVTIAHWVCKDGQPWKVGIGLFMGRGNGKFKDLEVKVSALEMTPTVVDHLILLRPEDDMALSGKSKTLWQEVEKRGRSARLEPVALEGFAALSAFPRWLTAVGEALPEGQPVPNLADFLQERCERLLEQVCMPVVP